MRWPTALTLDQYEQMASEVEALNEVMMKRMAVAVE